MTDDSAKGRRLRLEVAASSFLFVSAIYEYHSRGFYAAHVKTWAFLGTRGQDRPQRLFREKEVAIKLNTRLSETSLLMNRNPYSFRANLNTEVRSVSI